MLTKAVKTKIEKNKYLLTMIVAKRAKQLIAGGQPLIKTGHKNPVAIAMEEMKEGKIYLKKPSDPKSSLLDRILNLDYKPPEGGKIRRRSKK